ncbi:MAG TPA: hypothetical protein VHK64_04765 [Nocardioidaceae bacterium]|jgi:hypothetical protein|nr:hypothetical protein [Nocardioidaceae bacterium]
MAANIGGGRALRVCDLCGGVDDHPRHVITSNGVTVVEAPSEDIVNKVLDAAPKEERARLLRDLQDTTTSDRHLDCCAEAGCPTDTCGPQVRDAPGVGKKMLDHLMSIEDRFADRADVVKAE